MPASLSIRRPRAVETANFIAAKPPFWRFGTTFATINSNYNKFESGRIWRFAFRLDGTFGVASSRFQWLCVA
jgi:hypothetical protein